MTRWLATLGVVALGASSQGAPGLSYQLVRQGPERLKIAYAEPQRAVKDLVLERINRDRALHDLPPLRYDPRLSLVGDRFCLDAAMDGSFGHWDAAGRPPYVRWGLAGGVDFHVENAASYSSSEGRIDERAEDIALQLHESMMAERPPDDGHRRTILDRHLTHVGIGVAQVGGELRLSQEFSRVAFEWIELPDRPVQPGTLVEFAAQPLPGYEIGVVQIAFEPPPRRTRPGDRSRRGGYGCPPPIKTLRPALPRGWFYRGSDRGDFEVGRSGSFRVRFACDRGPGYYFVLCYVRRAGDRDPESRPATAAMITAR